MATVKGKLFYSYLTNLDTKYMQWKTTVVVTMAEAKRLRALGLKPVQTDPLASEEMAEAGPYKINFSRYLKKRSSGGGVNEPPKCVLVGPDGKKNWFSGIVGNGSDGEVSFRPYEWSNTHGSGTGSDLRGVVVTKLVEYEGSGSTEETDDTDDGDMFSDVEGDRPEFTAPEVSLDAKTVEEPETPAGDVVDTLNDTTAKANTDEEKLDY